MASTSNSGSSLERSVTITDIARLAGVSVSTVSRVLNNNHEVKKTTRKKVLAIIEEHGYRPSELARGLVNQSSKTIGILIPDIMNSYYTELIQSVETVVSRHGFSLFLCITRTDPELEKYYINEMMGRRTDGLIILSTKISDPRLLDKMRQSIEVVGVEAEIPDADRICVDNRHGTYEVISHLIEYGHRDIAFVGYRFYLSGLRQRLEGYKQALRDHGLPVREDFIIEQTRDDNAGFIATTELLARKHRPTAIHCMNEFLAAGAYLGVEQAGLRIPDDVSISAYDNLATSKLLRPTLTTASIPVAEMGLTAAELLIRNITEGARAVKRTVTFPTTLFVRGSTRRI